MVSLRSVPKSNWVKTSESEFDDVDCIVSSRGTLASARSIGSVTWVATSSAPAPGSAVMTVTKGSSMSGMSSCWSWPHE